jgi:hypothetical protein
MVVPVLAYAAIAHWKRALALAATLLGLAGAASWALDAFHGGWYRFYIFETLSRHSLAPEMIVGFWTHDVLRGLGGALALALVYLWSSWRGGDRRGALFYALAGAAMLGGSYVSKLNFGGFDNVLLWADAWLAIMAGLGLHAIGKLARPGDWLVPALYALCLAQFGLLAYHPLAQVPTAEDRSAGQAVVARLGALPGDVWVPYHPYMAVMAGKPAHAHGMAMVELLWGHGPVVEGVRREALDAIAARRFGAIVLDPVWFPPDLKQAIEARYHAASGLPALAAPWPVTGMHTRPEVVYLPGPAPGK